jgi:hypothetical protein
MPQKYTKIQKKQQRIYFKEIEEGQLRTVKILIIANTGESLTGGGTYQANVLRELAKRHTITIRPKGLFFLLQISSAVIRWYPWQKTGLT